ncbi:unnamed protein product [Lampetra planeri]
MGSSRIQGLRDTVIHTGDGERESACVDKQDASWSRGTVTVETNSGAAAEERNAYCEDVPRGDGAMMGSARGVQSGGGRVGGEAFIQQWIECGGK